MRKFYGIRVCKVVEVERYIDVVVVAENEEEANRKAEQLAKTFSISEYDGDREVLNEGPETAAFILGSTRDTRMVLSMDENYATARMTKEDEDTLDTASRGGEW